MVTPSFRDSEFTYPWCVSIPYFSSQCQAWSLSKVDI